jgi:hypothetical protein
VSHKGAKEQNLLLLIEIRGILSNIRYSPNTLRDLLVFLSLTSSQIPKNCYALGFELSLPQSSNNPKRKLVYLTPHTNKQTNNQTTRLQTLNYSRDSREMVFMKEAGGRSAEQQKRFKC